MAIDVDSFTRIITDSKYQFSVGTVVALLTVFPADWRLMVCVTVIATATIIAEGFRDYARNRDGPATGKSESTVAVNVGAGATGPVTPPAQSGPIGPSSADPYKRA